MTHQEIDKIAEKWAFKAAEEAENSGGFDVPDQCIEFIVGAIAEATDHLQATIECHERGDAMLLELVAPYNTPAWTKELPKEVHKCTPITEYATRTTPVKIKCIECGREL